MIILRCDFSLVGQVTALSEFIFWDLYSFSKVPTSSEGIYNIGLGLRILTGSGFGIGMGKTV